jgi:hypothetical protein
LAKEILMGCIVCIGSALLVAVLAKTRFSYEWSEVWSIERTEQNGCILGVLPGFWYAWHDMADQPAEIHEIFIPFLLSCLLHGTFSCFPLTE